MHNSIKLQIFYTNFISSHFSLVTKKLSKKFHSSMYHSETILVHLLRIRYPFRSNADGRHRVTNFIQRSFSPRKGSEVGRLKNYFECLYNEIAKHRESGYRPLLAPAGIIKQLLAIIEIHGLRHRHRARSQAFRESKLLETERAFRRFRVLDIYVAFRTASSSLVIFSTKS